MIVGWRGFVSMEMEMFADAGLCYVMLCCDVLDYSHWMLNLQIL